MNREWIVKFETNVDHLSGEEIGAALQILNEMGEVLDASYFSGIGKKNRPCGKLEVLCHKKDRESVAKAIFRHTHSLGIRIMEIERLTLDRNVEDLNFEDRQIKAKSYVIEGIKYQRPEADDLIRLAKEKDLGLPGLRIDREE